MADSAYLPEPQTWEHLPGRPVTLTPALAEGIRSLVLAGSSTRRAALSLGVPATTFERWRSLARKGRKPYAACFQAFEIAETVYLHGVEQTVSTATRDDWRAAAWLLSKRLPAEYGDAKQVARTLERIPDDQWATMIANYGGDPQDADFDADMRLLVQAKKAAADRAALERLPPERQRELIMAELERRGLPTKILLDD